MALVQQVELQQQIQGQQGALGLRLPYQEQALLMQAAVEDMEEQLAAREALEGAVTAEIALAQMQHLAYPIRAVVVAAELILLALAVQVVQASSSSLTPAQPN